MYLMCSKHQGSPPGDQIHLSYDILKFEFFLLWTVVLLVLRPATYAESTLRGAGNRDFLTGKTQYSTAVLSWATVRIHRTR